MDNKMSLKERKLQYLNKLKYILEYVIVSTKDGWTYYCECKYDYTLDYVKNKVIMFMRMADIGYSINNNILTTEHSGRIEFKLVDKLKINNKFNFCFYDGTIDNVEYY